MDILEVAADEPGELVDRIWPALPDHAEKFEPPGREDFSDGLQAREVGSLSGGDLLSRGHGLQVARKSFKPSSRVLISIRPFIFSPPSVPPWRREEIRWFRDNLHQLLHSWDGLGPGRPGGGRGRDPEGPGH